MTYTYNNLNQLTNVSEQITGAESTATKNTVFTYDANGNTLSKRTYGQDDEEVIQYTYNPLNQLTEFEDAEGNVTTYAYDGTGMRVSKTQGTNVQRFYWDRGYIVNESLNGTFTASNSVGSQGVFARTTDDVTDYLFKNAHGDVTDIVSDDEVTNEYEYDAYGNQKNISASDTNPFRYCGEYYDEESGLIYLRNRYYDANIGRFITEDPIQDGMNWYAYCGNNPVIRFDPFGTNWITDWIRDMYNAGYESEMLKNKVADNAQKKIQREFWEFGSQHILKEKWGYLTSAWMLEYSLQDNPSDVWRGNDSRIAYLINNDAEYLSKLDAVIKSSNNGKVDQYLNDIMFQTGDLYYSIHKATIHVEGYLQKNGKWIIHSTLTDKYDFTEIQTFMDDNGGWSTQSGIGTIANDAAAFSQFFGAINPYNITVEFFTTR